MKLSDELKRCLDGSGCGNCEYHEADTKFICSGLLEKAYERIKGYEDMFPCNVGDAVYMLKNGQVLRNYIVQIHISQTIAQTIFSCYGDMFGIEQLGKTVFLTREQAEAELKKNEEVEDKNGN